MKKSWKIFFWSLFSLVLAVLIAARLLTRLEVDVWEVKPQTVIRQVTEEGNIKAGIEYTVYAMFRGRLDSIAVKEGEMVAEGQLLAVIDNREMLYELDEMKARLRVLEGEELKLTEQPGTAAIAEKKLAIKQAEAQYEAAAREYKRRKKLYAEDAIAEEQYRRAEDFLVDTEYQLSRQREALRILHETYDPPPGSREIIAARHLAYQARKDIVRYRLSEHRIHSPIAGSVGRLQPEEKEMIDPQTPLMTIFLEDHLLVEVEVLTRDVLHLAPGMEVALTFDSRDEEIEFTGQIVRIAPQAELDLSPLGLEERRVKVTVVPELPAGLELGPGYELDVTFVTEEKSDQLAVPERALFTVQGHDALFVVEEDGRVTVRRVITGVSGNREIAIEEGVEAGDMVIINPQIEGLQEGVRVRANVTADF